MPITDKDLAIVRVLIEDADTLSNVLPPNADGQQLGNDVRLASTLLSDDADDDEKRKARAETRKTCIRVTFTNCQIDLNAAREETASSKTT